MRPHDRKPHGPQVSPDGNYSWDGQAWQPIRGQAPAPPQSSIVATDAEIAGSLSEAMNHVQDAIGRVDKIFSADTIDAAFGPPGVPGNPVRIYELATRILEIYSELTLWAERIRSIPSTGSFRRLIELHKAVLERPIAQIREFIAHTVEQLDRLPALLEDHPQGPQITIRVVLQLDVDEHLVAEAMRELQVHTELISHGSGMAKALRLRSLTNPSIQAVDAMDGVSFERRLAQMFRDLGNAVDFTPATGDYGADLIVRHPMGDSFVVQAKCQVQAVGLGAVQEIIGARVHYRISRALVITNSTFTSSAEVLALSAGVELWNRDRLTVELHRAGDASGAEQHAVLPEVQPGPWSIAGAESPAAGVSRTTAVIQDILLTRPKGWEYLFYARVLDLGLASLETRRGTTHTPLRESSSQP